MNDSEQKLDQAETMLREAYLKQSIPQPTAPWHDALQKQIHNTSVPWQKTPKPDNTLWTIAWSTALAALLAVVFGLITVPSKTQMAWQINQDYALSTWAFSNERY